MKTGFWSDFAGAFTRPFRKENRGATLQTLIFMLIPFAGFIGIGAAYTLQSGGRRSIGRYAKTGLKITLAHVLLAAPVLLIYAVQLLLSAYFSAYPFYISLIFLAAYVFFIVRLLVLMPIASCSVAYGMPLREAVNGRQLKSILGGCVFTYIFCSLIVGILVYFAGGFTNMHRGIIGYLLSAVLGTVYYLFSAGLYMACCRRSMGINPPPSSGRPTAKRYRTAAAAMVLVLLVSAAAPAARALSPEELTGDPVPVDPADGAAGQKPGYEAPRTYMEAYYRFAKDGKLGPGTDIRRRDDGTYYLGVYQTQAEVEAVQFVNKTAEVSVAIADIGLDFVPVIGEVKNTLQMGYYGYKYYTETDPQKKRTYGYNVLYKGIGLGFKGLGSAATWAKGADLANNKGVSTTLAYVMQQEWFYKNLEAFNTMFDGYDKLKTLIDLENLASGKENTLDLDKFFDDPTAATEEAGERLKDLITLQSFTKRDDPKSTIPDTVGGQTGKSASTDPKKDESSAPSESQPEDSSVPESAAESAAETSVPSDPDPFGSYSGTSSYTVYGNIAGLKYTGTTGTVDVIINNDNTAHLITTVEFGTDYTIQGVGKVFSAVSKTPVDVDGIPLVKNTIEKLTYQKTVPVTSTYTVDYQGQGYVNGGGNASDTAETTCTITITVTWVDITYYEISGTINFVTKNDPSGSFPNVDVGFTCSKNR
ncbi:MAG: tripartite tricarboxylate transporter TctB family protein [Firmicutes bacterium]|nr:tripartite tricarboxylate transporter TctB family protein [Bacillota bacterium]